LLEELIDFRCEERIVTTVSNTALESRSPIDDITILVDQADKVISTRYLLISFC